MLFHYQSVDKGKALEIIVLSFVDVTKVVLSYLGKLVVLNQSSPYLVKIIRADLLLTRNA